MQSVNFKLICTDLVLIYDLEGLTLILHFSLFILQFSMRIFRMAGTGWLCPGTSPGHAVLTIRSASRQPSSPT